MANSTLPHCDDQDTDIWNEDRRIDYLPNTREIRLACEQIRAGWTHIEQRRRYVGQLMTEETTNDWRPPVVDTSHLRVRTGVGHREAI